MKDFARGLLLAGAVASFPAEAFDSFEHRFLGEHAYCRAKIGAGWVHKDPSDPKHCEELKDPGASRFRARLDEIEKKLGFGRPAQVLARRLTTRLADLVPVSFGDLPALAGDFIANPDELLEMVDLIRKHLAEPDGVPLADTRRLVDHGEALVLGTRRQWVSACNWLYGTRLKPDVEPNQYYQHCFDGLAKDPKPDGKRIFVFASIGYRPERNELAEQEAIPGFVELAARNQSHFPRHSWKAYADYHRVALRLATCFRDYVTKQAEKQPGCNRVGEPARTATEKVLDEGELLIRMLVNEGFAQHFLQDSFASGHIGTKFGSCSYEVLTFELHCRPTKIRLQHTHDALNSLGLKVRLVDEAADRTGLGGEAWTAFGDRHLFTPEADLHRAIVLRMSTQSLEEVFERAGGKDQSTEDTCGMCTTSIFPVEAPDAEELLAEPVAAIDNDYASEDLAVFEPIDRRLPGLSDERSTDPRVPILPVEGWKVGAAVAKHYGNDDSGTSGGIMLRMDYMRSTGPTRPNVYGIELWNFLDRGASYLFTVGWARPREVSLTQIAAKLKLGARWEESTMENGSRDRRSGLEAAIGVDLTYEIYRPLSIFTHFEPISVFRTQGSTTIEHYGKASGKWAIIGLRFDLSGI